MTPSHAELDSPATSTEMNLSSSAAEADLSSLSAQANQNSPAAKKAEFEFYASCPEGFEQALADELRRLGLRRVRPLKGRVTFSGAQANAYRACLWSRLASRVFVVLARFTCHDADELYTESRSIAWEDILNPSATIAVTARGTTDELRNSHFSALRVKDAICDRLTEVRGTRPSVDTEHAGARIVLTLRGERASLQLDLSGEPLFKRLPCEATHAGAAHVLRPDYAALALAHIGWQAICEQADARHGASGHRGNLNTETNAWQSETKGSAGVSKVDLLEVSTETERRENSIESEPFAGTSEDRSSANDTEGEAAATPTLPVLIDLCCAGGGIALEAAHILADRAPGADRTHWGFTAWAEHDAPAWEQLQAEALARAEAARERTGLIVATDISGEAVAYARRVIKAAKPGRSVIFAQPNAEHIARKLSPARNARIQGTCVIDTTETSLTKLPRVVSLVSDLFDEGALSRVAGAGASEVAVAEGGEATRPLPLVALTRDSMLERFFGEPATSLDIMPNNEEAHLLVFGESAITPRGNNGLKQGKGAQVGGTSAPATSTARKEQGASGRSEASAGSAAPVAHMNAQAATGPTAATPVPVPAPTPIDTPARSALNAGSAMPITHTDALAPAGPAAATSTPIETPAHGFPANGNPLAPRTTLIDLGDGEPCPVLIPESEQFARRLRKVAKQRRKWARRAGVTCYRIYDADLPDYSAAIDLYEGSAATPGRWLVIAEYAAPASVDPSLAQARMLDILTIAPRVLNIEPDNVFAKARTRSRGGSQYGKGSQPGLLGPQGANANNAMRESGHSAAERNRTGSTYGAKAAHGRANHSGTTNPAGRNGNTRATSPRAGKANAAHTSGAPLDIRTRPLPLIEEGGLTFAVNFDDYLDTGIFLDHRLTRDLVRERARGKRFFLNLFAYTGTATCYAADAGVEETVTVDLSNTYLDWAERNMELNGFTGREHHFVRADVMRWIADMRATRNRWDLIFCDPPTFSNSSKMGRRTWDVQRDHVELLIGLSRLLTRDGEAIFSCNLRTFRPDTEALARAGVILTDITRETIPEDFSRNQRIHRCYLLHRYTPEEAMRLAGMSDAAIRERQRELRAGSQGRAPRTGRR